jgi:hypothetical protein
VRFRRVLRGATASAGLAFRMARFAKNSIGELLAGKLPPPGACPQIGRSGPIVGNNH